MSTNEQPQLHSEFIFPEGILSELNGAEFDIEHTDNKRIEGTFVAGAKNPPLVKPEEEIHVVIPNFIVPDILDVSFIADQDITCSEKQTMYDDIYGVDIFENVPIEEQFVRKPPAQKDPESED